MQITVEAKQEPIGKPEIVERKGSLIPVGGGKDSNVTLDLLQEEKQENLCFLLGGKEPSVQCAKTAGYTDETILTASRKIDENLIHLNQEGYLNGHTPFSALLAFTTYLVAYLTGKKQIALSNESSAEETNVEGEKINHQYSKTLEFENDFRSYCQKYLENQANYFSLLRPINELQIAMLFSRLKPYHSIFRSCNVGSKQIPWIWCGNCPKCLFVFIMLSPFLYKKDLISIFGEDLYEKQELQETFEELCGYGKTKPFECVGTYEEVNYAITKTIQDLKEKKIALPYLLHYYETNYSLASLKEDMTKRYNEENNVPKELEVILKRKVFHD